MAFEYANLHDILPIPLSNLLLIAAFPHLPFAQVYLPPEYPRSMAPTSNITSLRYLVEELPF